MSHRVGAMSSGRVGLVVNAERPRARELADAARHWWADQGYEVLDFDVRSLRPGDPHEKLDFAVSLGGDGTMLRTAQLALVPGIPVLGVNLGTFGYLTQVEPSRLEAAFGLLVAGNYEVEERMTLEVMVHGTLFAALNEVTVEKTSAGRTIGIRLAITGRPFLTYAADGLLVATPTGSTAYNLSLRGPIVSPRLRALVVTPISPHMLFDRSLVLEPDDWVQLSLTDAPGAVVVADGTAVAEVGPDAEIVVRAGAHNARIVRFEAPDFHAVLRHKFNLADR